MVLGGVFLDTDWAKPICYFHIFLKKRIYILIENKITASFQEQQYERYEERKKLYLRDKLCDIAYSILIAPKLYCDNQNDFEYFITYEEIIKRLEFTASKRNLFKSQLLKIGAEKLRSPTS